MRTLIVTVLAACALLPVATASAAPTPMSEIREGALNGCRIAYAITTDMTKPQIRRACPRVWATFDRGLTDRQIRVWYRDIRAKRDPVRYMGHWTRAMARHSAER